MMLVSAVPALAYTTGTYTGTGTGMLDKIEVAVTFDADTITGIEVVSCNDTPGVCDAAVEKIPAEIVKYQSLGVDVATSATFKMCIRDRASPGRAAESPRRRGTC